MSISPGMRDENDSRSIISTILIAPIACPSRDVRALDFSNN